MRAGARVDIRVFVAELFVDGSVDAGFTPAGTQVSTPAEITGG
jgi:hypothetical protein